jgi:hypothetical protein
MRMFGNRTNFPLNALFGHYPSSGEALGYYWEMSSPVPPSDAVRRTIERAGQFDYPATQLGVVGAPGQTQASQMLGRVISPYVDMEGYFGMSGGTMNVITALLNGDNAAHKLWWG